MLIKVCGMREPENIRQVAETGIDWMGFIFYTRSARSIDNGKWTIENERKSSSLNNSQFSILNFQFNNIPIDKRIPISSILREVSPNMLFNFLPLYIFTIRFQVSMCGIR